MIRSVLRRTGFRLAAGTAMMWLLAVTVAAVAGPARTPEALGDWAEHAYLDRDPAPVADLLAWLAEEKLVERRRDMAPRLAGLLAEFFRAHPEAVPVWIAPVATSGPTTRSTVALALWLAGRAELARTLSPPGAKLPGAPPDLATERPRTAVEIDLRWGAFFASGRDDYVGRIVDALDGDGDLRRVAEDSLAANLTRHERIVHILRDEAARRPPEIRARIEALLDRAVPRHTPFPATDGEFSALLLVADQAALAEFSRPSSEAPTFTSVTRAKTDRKVFVKAIFTGQRLNEALECAVTWDVVVTDPSGKRWSGPELTNLEAIKGRVPTRWNVYDARGFPTLWFEASDPLGVYRIRAEIRDEIAGRKVVIDTTLEHVE